MWLRIAVLVALFKVFPLHAGEGIGVGEIVPPWSGLIGIDGKEHGSAELADSKAVAVVFFANHCPDCQNYTDRILSLARDYREKGVAIVLVSVSRVAEDDLAHMKEWATAKQFQGLYLQDKSQRIGRTFGAEVTPEIFILDRGRKLVYRGAIDDHWKTAKVKNQFARQALDAVLAGKAPSVTRTEAEGCTIVYDEEE